MKRLKEISGAFIRHGFMDVFSKLGLTKGLSTPSKDDSGKTFTDPARIRMAFEELGPTFIKLGQLLSLQPDIIPPEFIDEFKKLQDEVPPFPFEEVNEILQFELGASADKLFGDFDEKPLAAASVAQVHVAILKSGEKVVVKVQRPGIEAAIREDIKILYKIAELMVKNFKNFALMNPIGIIAEFEGFIFKELDFATEASSIEKFRSNFKDDPDIAIPEVYWDFTTPRILVMEHFDGCPTDDLESIRKMGLDTRRLAEIGLTCFAKQVMVYGFYHADPHPGNAIVMQDGRIALIDFGITAFMDNEFRRDMANIVVGFHEHDYDRLITIFRKMEIIKESTSLKSFKRDLIELSEPYYGRSLEHISIKDIFDKVCKLAIKHEMRLPREMVLLFKSLIAGEHMGRVMCAEINILDVMKPYAVNFLNQAYDPKTIINNMRHDFFTYSNFAKDVPEFTHRILKNISKGDQQINIHISGMENLDKDFGNAASRISLGMLIGSSLISAAWILSSNSQILPIDIPSLGLYNVSLTTVLGLIGYAIASVLGIWLIFYILGQGKSV